MAGRKPRGGGRRNRQSDKADASPGRRTHVPPIIDLEATIVEDADENAAGKAENEGKSSQTGGEAGGEHRGGAFADDPPETWVDEMKRFLFGGVHVGRWRIPAAGSIVIALIFIGGLAAGYLAAPDGDAPAMRNAAELEAVLRQSTAANETVAQRLTALDEKLETTLAQVQTLEREVQTLADAGSSDPSEAVAAVEKQIGALNARLAQMAEQTATEPGAGLPEAVGQRLDGLAEAVDSLRQSVEAVAARQAETQVADPQDADALADAVRERIGESVNAILAGVETRLKTLEADIAAASNKALPPASVAAANLQKAVDAGRNFQPELSALGAVLPGDPAIAELAAHAPNGVLPASEITARFETIAASLSAPPSEQDPAAQEDGFFGEMWDKVRRLVVVRKAGEPGSRSVTRAVEAARALLEKGDLIGAADAMAGAAADPDGEIARWVEQARARARADRAINALLRRAVTAPAAAAEPSES